MSKTPRMTKTEGIRLAVAYGHVARDRIEELETELAGARAEIERKDALIEQMRAALKEIHAAVKPAIENGTIAMARHYRNIEDAYNRAGAALEAAERGK